MRTPLIRALVRRVTEDREGPVNWEEAVAYALRLPGTELGLSYGKPAVKLSSNQRAFLYAGHESATSFCVRIEHDRVAELLASDPRTFFQTAHYIGSDALLVRYDAGDVKRIRALLAEAHAQAATRAPSRTRSRSRSRKKKG